MLDDIRTLSLNNLISRLHDAVVEFVKNVGSIVQENKELAMSDIRDLREHISRKLANNEEVADNKKLLKLLDLFATDKAVLELIKEDAEEWVGMLEAIEERLESRGENITKGERREIDEINRLTSEIKRLARK